MEINKIFLVPAMIETVFTALTDRKTLSEWQEDDCISEVKVGGKISQFGGWAEGTYQFIESPTHIRYTWRVPEWGEEAEDSIVDLALKSTGENETEVILSHTNLPSQEERDAHAEGWDNYYFDPLIDWLTHNN